MNANLSEDEVRIFDAFFQRYIQMSEGSRIVLEKLDDTERRTAIAKLHPQASKFLEGQTQQEMKTKLMILAIASSVASAIVEGLHLQGK